MITAVELAALAYVLLSAPGTTVRLLVGLPLLAHLGYTALTSLPMGAIPGRPAGAKQERRNQDLRSRVVGFLNEVRRVEEYAQHAKAAGRSQREIDADLRSAQRRMMQAAAQVAQVTGKTTVPPTEAPPASGKGSVRVLTHAPPGSRAAQTH